MLGDRCPALTIVNEQKIHLYDTILGTPIDRYVDDLKCGASS